MDSPDKIFLLARELTDGNETDKLASSILMIVGGALLSSNELGFDHIERLAAAVLATSNEFRAELIPEKERGLLEDFKRKLFGN